MLRTRELASAVLVASIGLAACGGNNPHRTVTPAVSTTLAAPGTGVGGPSSTTTAAVATTAAPSGGTIAKAACSLVTPEQVKAILGLPPVSAGHEQDNGPTDKTCSWLTAPPPGGNVNSMRLGVVLTSATSKGFGPPSQPGNPTPVAGVGDTATYYSTPPGASFAVMVLVADKGAVSLEIDLNYGGTPGPPAGVEAAVATVAQAIFTQING